MFDVDKDLLKEKTLTEDKGFKGYKVYNHLLEKAMVYSKDNFVIIHEPSSERYVVLNSKTLLKEFENYTGIFEKDKDIKLCDQEIVRNTMNLYKDLGGSKNYIIKETGNNKYITEEN